MLINFSCHCDCCQLYRTIVGSEERWRRKLRHAHGLAPLAQRVRSKTLSRMSKIITVPCVARGDYWPNSQRDPTPTFPQYDARVMEIPLSCSKCIGRSYTDLIRDISCVPKTCQGLGKPIVTGYNRSGSRALNSSLHQSSQTFLKIQPHRSGSMRYTPALLALLATATVALPSSLRSNSGSEVAVQAPICDVE